MSESLQACPSCHRELPVPGAAFCPYCGAPIVKAESVPDQVREALAAVQKTDDPVKQHQLLTAADEACPNCLAIQRELLHLGRLHERNPKKLDYSVIKCYLLQYYLTPDEFSQERKNAMRTELTEGEQLKRCQALAPDPEGFTREYLERLSREFIHLFLEGSSIYMRSLFGLTFRKNTPRLLAPPAARMLYNMQNDGALSTVQREMLMNAFYRAFAMQVDNETAPLVEELQKLGCSMPR